MVSVKAFWPVLRSVTYAEFCLSLCVMNDKLNLNFVGSARGPCETAVLGHSVLKRTTGILDSLL